MNIFFQFFHLEKLSLRYQLSNLRFCEMGCHTTVTLYGHHNDKFSCIF
jgi:hypothetical protein